MVVLQETSEKLKIQAEKAKIDLGGIAKEFGEDSIELLTVATENSPEPVKEVVETLASSTDNLNDVSKVRDFQLVYYFLLPGFSHSCCPEASLPLGLASFLAAYFWL
ncbi:TRANSMEMBRANE PROTEIN 14-like protein [Salix koriyanagi]|uniref:TRANSMEMBRANE PROTEIN 14-like protein n=1 Tax=Salix koriyanagi TaxID=2511006 RepID=A0A9Q0ZUD4_9ROSI|nr:TRANSMEMBRANE PROTEIN 14-like protein [Salix koriyanagi]